MPPTEEILPTLYCNLDRTELDSDTMSDANNYDVISNMEQDTGEGEWDVLHRAEGLWGYGDWSAKDKVAVMDWLLWEDVINTWDPEDGAGKALLAKLGCTYGQMVILSKVFWEMPAETREMVLRVPVAEEEGLLVPVDLWFRSSSDGQRDGVVSRGYFPFQAVNRVQEFVDHCVQEMGGI